jgi:uncharacterized membrane protein
MAGLRILILVMHVTTGLLLIALSIPLIRGKIGPNHWYGLRVRRTLEDPAVWYKANAYSGKTLVAMGIVMVLASMALYPAGSLDAPTYGAACAAITVGSLAASMFLSFRFLGRIAGKNDHQTNQSIE